MILVGHGPSVCKGLGVVIDTFTVVRCKSSLPTLGDTKDYGTRTDYWVIRPGSPHISAVPKDKRHCIWEFPYEGHGLPNWVSYWKKYSPKLRKYSHGLAAAFLAMDRLKPDSLTVIGYDRLLGRFDTGKSWDQSRWQRTSDAHDWPAEQAALHGLGVPIVELCQTSSNTTP